MIIYQFWLHIFDGDDEDYLFARRNDIKSNIPILQKGMELMIDGMVLKIEYLSMDLETEPEDINTDIEEIQIAVHIHGGDQSEGCLNAESLEDQGWKLINDEREYNIQKKMKSKNILKANA